MISVYLEYGRLSRATNLQNFLTCNFDPTAFMIQVPTTNKNSTKDKAFRKDLLRALSRCISKLCALLEVTMFGNELGHGSAAACDSALQLTAFNHAEERRLLPGPSNSTLFTRHKTTTIRRIECGLGDALPIAFLHSTRSIHRDSGMF